MIVSPYYMLPDMDMIKGLRGGKVSSPLTPLTGEECSELKEILRGLGRKLKA